MQANNQQVRPEMSEEEVWRWLEDVPDPEIPVLSVIDLGIIRTVKFNGSTLEVGIAPTYSGCPATEVIEQGVMQTLLSHGVAEVKISRVLSPPWTTDWITSVGREKLLAYGIAPPSVRTNKQAVLDGFRKIACPQCQSTDTMLVSEFGSTACKASYKCRDCLEPFEYFKCI